MKITIVKVCTSLFVFLLFSFGWELSVLYGILPFNVAMSITSENFFEVSWFFILISLFFCTVPWIIGISNMEDNFFKRVPDWAVKCIVSVPIVIDIAAIIFLLVMFLSDDYTSAQDDQFAITFFIATGIVSLFAAVLMWIAHLTGRYIEKIFS